MGHVSEKTLAEEGSILANETKGACITCIGHRICCGVRFGQEEKIVAQMP